MADTVQVGLISKPFGVRGEVVLFPYGAPRETVELLRGATAVTLAGRRATIEGARLRTPTTLLLKFKGVDTRDAAEGLRDTRVGVPEAALAPLGGDGNYYHYQLLGLAVRFSSGTTGVLERIITTPANDVYVVASDNGSVLVPAISSVVRAVDLESGTMTVDMEGCVKA